jgi:alpha-1,2-mannosyltransferase
VLKAHDAGRPPPGPSLRLRLAAAAVFSRPALLWVVAALFALRTVVLTVLAPDRPDARGWWAAGRRLLDHPHDLYGPAAAALARLHMLPVPGDVDGFFSPPLMAYLAVPFALLPQAVGSEAWTLANAAAALGGLVVLQKAMRPARPLAVAFFWLLAAVFPPLFADISAGQVGGFLLLLAAGAIYLEGRAPVWAGGLAGLAAALKLYPAVLLLGAGPGRRLRFGGALLACFAGVTALSFVPLGAGTPRYYWQHVLSPVLAIDDPDCAFVSSRTLLMRTLGGESYVLPGPSGLITVTTPIHAPELAMALSYLLSLVLVIAAVWAARRSGWQPLYAFCLAFALGALIPSHVFPYQMLPLLPLILLLGVRAVEERRAGVLIAIGVFMLGFIRQPCDLLFPNLWTLAGLGVFALGVSQNRLFQDRPKVL